MCGVFGLVVERDSGLDPASIGPILRRLYRVSESRGKEAAGLALHVEGQPGIEVRKAAVRGSRLIAAPSSRRLLESAREGAAQGARIVLLGHTRMVTNGDPSDNGNNQPVVGDRVVVLHNGIITNELNLWERNPDLERSHEVDTELVVRLIERDLATGSTLAAAFDDVTGRIAGANTLAVLDGERGDLALGTANGSLYFARAGAAGQDSRLLVFASERPILERALRRRTFGPSVRRPQFGAVQQLEPGRTLLSLCDERGGTVVASVRGAATGEGADDGTRHPSDRIARIAGSLAGLVTIDDAAIGRLRRCTRCVLPESFPGIRFDREGVCSVCASYRSPESTGAGALVDRLEPGAKVLFPLSGGRDSCYGLHVAVRELGLDVVAFTYDWGMVTDLARRNISRMCGKLGVEHVLVSADIARKRRYVRDNILAWLRRPELGTIPLFMAGDKQFFFHAQRLRAQHEASLVLFSHNPYERTDFKSGFAGVSDAERSKPIYYNLASMDKLRLLAYYAKQAALNPAYLNASIVDSLTGYLSYYLIPKRYASLYDHVEWREPEVDRTLIQEYAWETAPDAASTWRIGDGSAAFYNLLYLKMAGFTENDALRSNQIRAGHIDREWALLRLPAENAPRLPSLAWYFDVLGLDGQHILRRVQALPARY